MNKQQERELYLLDYMEAMDADDKATIAKLVAIAKNDPIFKQMIVDFHSRLETTELFPPDGSSQDSSN
ncbi:MAG: hypothetical protein AAFV93_00760 [Chloroflexota bacterium]